MFEAVSERGRMWFWLVAAGGVAAVIVGLVRNPVAWAPLSMIYAVISVLYFYQVRLPEQAKFLLHILCALGCLWALANIFYDWGR